LCNVDAMADVSRCKDTDAEVIKAAMWRRCTIDELQNVGAAMRISHTGFVPGEHRALA
jgi:hypothetical protein